MSNSKLHLNKSAVSKNSPKPVRQLPLNSPTPHPIQQANKAKKLNNKKQLQGCLSHFDRKNCTLEI